jgi:hypothetical protein
MSSQAMIEVAKVDDVSLIVLMISYAGGVFG